MSDILYHYTSLDTFLKIAESKQIRLSDLSQSNDALEGRFIFDHLVEGLRRSKLPPQHLTVFEEQLEDMIEFERAFGFCLSEKKDDLSQWRGYGDDGRGVCIGFDRHQIEVAVRATSVATKNAKLEQVNYGKHGVDAIVAKLIEEVSMVDWSNELLADIEEEFFHYWIIEGPNELDLVKASARAFVALSNSIERCFQFKSHAFESEKEWRILLPGGFSDGDEVAYHSSATRIIAYLSASVGASVSQVIIGPKSSVSEQDMQRVLRRLQLKTSATSSGIKVSTSGASYR